MRVTAADRKGLFGRDQELADLVQALDTATRGNGQLVLVTGDAGIGKTSLLEALAGHVAVTDVRMVWGRCWEAGGVQAYWPWTQVLQSCTAELDMVTVASRLGPDAAELVHVLPELAMRLPGLSAALPSDSPAARVRLFDAVSTFLKSAAAVSGLVVALEDLHAGDEASLHLLAYVARGLADTRVLLVGTYREAEVVSSPRLRRLMNAVTIAGIGMPLSGLDHRAVARLLERATGEVVTAETARNVREGTDGNPFFVQEVGRLLVRGDKDPRVPLTEEVESLVHRRLGRLPSAVRGLLARAALVGRDFDSRLLARLTGQSTDEVLDGLAEAQAVGAVKAIGLGRWSFAHALIREALETALDGQERQALHRRIGEATETLYADDLQPHYTTLAYHYSQGGGAAKALHYARAAGDQAMTSLAFEEASLQYGRALDALATTSPTDERHRYELLMACATAQFRGQDFDAARKSHRQACKVARTVGDPELFGRAVMGFTGYLGGGEETVRLLEEALAWLPDGDSAVKAQVMVTAGGVHLLGMAPAGAAPQGQKEWRRVAEQGVDMARRVGDRSLASLLVMWHRVLLDLDVDTLDERLAVAEEAVRRSQALGDQESEFFARCWLFGDLVDAGRMVEAAAALEASSRLAGDLRLPYFLWAVSHQRAALAIHDGRLDEGERLVRESLGFAERTGSVDSEGVFRSQLGVIWRHQGRFEEMADLEQPDPQTYPARPLALAELGRPAEAQELVSQILAVSRTASPRRRVVLAADLADACWTVGGHPAVEELYGILQPYPEHHVVQDVAIRTMGSSSRSLGQLATLLGRLDDADDHFNAAHRHHERLGAPVWLAHGQSDHARMLLSRGRPGDRSRAAQLAASARAGFRALGLSMYGARASALVEEAGAAPDPEVGVLRLEGREWFVSYEGRIARLGDSLGLRHLATLLAHAGQELDAVDLADIDDPERARQSVSRTLRTAVGRIGEVHPTLGDHLGRTVRTGYRCSYVPDPRAPVAWKT